MVRAFVVGGVSLVETTWLAWRLESAPLKQSTNPLLALLGEEGIVPLAAAVASGTVLCASARWRAGVRQAAAALATEHPMWRVWLAAQGAVFLVFSWLTTVVLGEALTVPIRVAVWVGLGGLWGGLMAAALLPPEGLRASLRPALAGGLAGTAIGIVAWGMGFVSRAWWIPLGGFTGQAASGLLVALGVPAVWMPVTLELAVPEFTIAIAPSCSGYQGIALLWVFLGTYLWLFRANLRFPAALWLLVIGTVAVWAANVVRIAILMIVGWRVSPELAVGGFHSSAGVLFYCVLALSLAWWAQEARMFSAGAARRERLAGPAAAYLAPFLAMLGAGLVGRAVSAGGLEWGHPLRSVAGGVALWRYWRWHGDLRVRCSWAAVGTGVLVFALWLVLAPPGAPGETRPPELRWPPETAEVVWLVLRVFGAVLAAPLAEELAFRGYLARRMVGVEFEKVPPRSFSWRGCLGSSLAFGMLHPRPIAATLAGIAYYRAMQRRGELSDAVVAHATTNALLLVTALSTGAWGLLG